jgi:hypothetical protein
MNKDIDKPNLQFWHLCMDERASIRQERLKDHLCQTSPLHPGFP